MSSPDYVWEKTLVAVECLCGEGSFTKRLENATVSALIRLQESDLQGDLREDLRFVLSWTKKNMLGGSLQREPDEEDRRKLVNTMLRILLETHSHGHGS